MLIDIVNNGVTNVIDLINDTNTTALTEADISLGAPTVFDDPEGTNDRNTELVVSGKSSGGFTGDVTVRYSRLELSTLPKATGLQYTLTGAESIDDILTAVATKLAVAKSAVKLDVAEVPTVAAGETGTINIQATDNSLLYIGAAAVTVNPGETPIDSEVTTQDLGGFDEPVE